MPSFNEKEIPMQPFKDFGRLTKHGSTVHTQLEKVNDMYPLKWSNFNHSDVEKSLEKVLGPLSLFAPTTQDDEVPVIEQLLLERPVTPIDEEIKVQPQTIDQLIRYIRRRIMAKTDVPFLSVEDQKNLAAIIISEVNGIWPDIRKQIDDPFLTVQENKELYRRIAVYIVTVCEKVFHHYLKKAQVLNSRGVFSGPANTSRLKVQLALKVSELLNILKIRRHIINGIKMDTEQTEEAEASPRSMQPSNFGSKLTYKAMLEGRHSRTKRPKTEINTAEHEIKEIQNRMPVLDIRSLTELLTDLQMRGRQSNKDLHTKQSHISHTPSHTTKITKDAQEQKIVFKRCKSQPEFGDGGSIFDELCIDHNVKVDKLLSLELELLTKERQRMVKRAVTTQDLQVQTGSRDFIERDLRKLAECKQDEFLSGNIKDDLPPLVQAITRHARHDDLKQRMEKQLSELESRQKIRAEEECVLVRGPDHPQPDTVSSHLGKAGVIRTSDIRVSERVCMSSITLKRHATVYNDLLDEIDHVTVKGLDTNLTLSDEIHEVYKEIMRTVPSTHMDLDDDLLVQSAPESLDITKAMVSATLFYRGPKRIINPVFRKVEEPPWAGHDWKQWARTPVNPPKDIQGEDLFAPVIPDMAKINSFMHSFEKMKQTGKPSSTDEKMYHSYTSWLQWWKSTMTNEDYMKYLSIQDTDFLGAVFHFYDSDDDDDDDESVNEKFPNKLQRFPRRSQLSTKSKVSAEEKERLGRLEELRTMKSEFKQGFWNANSVLMGGLGKDPELEENKHNGNRTVRLVEPAIKNQVGQRKKSPDKKNRLSSMSRTTTEKHKSETSVCDNTPLPQDRLESVWQRLQMPDSGRLDMAIKYSCNNYFSKLTEAIERWEAVCERILQRETLLINLEKFERQASDPNRFFAKDSKNSSYRLEESRQRACLYKKIDALDLAIKEEIEHIHNQFQDVITYRGRPYLDKMKWDRTEMLYWLAEERKENGLKYEAIIQGLNLPLRPAQLQPIVPSGRLQ